MIPRRPLLAATAVLALTLTACAPLGSSAPRDDGVTLRLWDPQVAEAYRESLAVFTARSGIPVDVVVVPWADYS